MDRLIRMLLNMFLRRGMKHLSRRSRKNPRDMTPEERAQDRTAREAAERAQKAARLTRKL